MDFGSCAAGLVRHGQLVRRHRGLRGVLGPYTCSFAVTLGVGWAIAIAFSLAMGWAIAIAVSLAMGWAIAIAVSLAVTLGVACTASP